MTKCIYYISFVSIIGYMSQRYIEKRRNAEIPIASYFTYKQDIHLPTLPKESNVVIQLFVYPPRPLIEHLMSIIYARVEMLKPADESWVDAGIFLLSRMLLSHVVFPLNDESHDLRQGYPVCVQQNDDLVVGIDELLE